MRTLVKHILAATEPKEAVTVKGWVRPRRDSKGFSFLELNDGSCLANVQVVVDTGTPGSEHLPQLTTGASAVVGTAVSFAAFSRAPSRRRWALRFFHARRHGDGEL